MAAALKLSDRGPFVQSCAECNDPDKRLAWGCDGPTATDEAAVTLPCFVCSGQSDKCAACSGTGTIEVRDCPNRRVRAEHLHAIDSIVQLESGVLPAPGGWHDQAATFVSAFPLLANELGEYRDRAAKRAHDKAQRRTGAR